MVLEVQSGKCPDPVYPVDKLSKKVGYFKIHKFMKCFNYLICVKLPLIYKFTREKEREFKVYRASINEKNNIITGKFLYH